MLEKVIHQGDQYHLPMTLTLGGEIVTDENVDAVRIIFGNFIDEWPNGTLYFLDDQWYYPLSQEMTLRLPPGKIEIEAQFMKNGDIIGSGTDTVRVKKSQFEDEWDVHS